MAGDGSGVTARDRTRECGLAALKCVLQRCSGERGDHALGDAAGSIADQLLAQQFLAPQCGAQCRNGVEQQGDAVIAGMGKGGVIQRAGVLAHAERLPADLQDQGLGDGVTDFVDGGDAEARVGQPVDVLVGTRERHRGMDGQRDAPLLGQRAQDRDPVRARRVHDDRAAMHRARRRETRDHACEFGIGNRQQKQFRARGDVVDRQDRSVGQATLGALSRLGRYGAARDDDVLRTLQRDAERSAHPSGGDDADGEPGGTQSVRGTPRVRGLHHRRRPHKVGVLVRSDPAGEYRTVALRLAHSSRRRRRPPPPELACNRVNNSESGWPPSCWPAGSCGSSPPR